MTTQKKFPEPRNESATLRLLVADHARLREVGCNLAEAALRVIRDYDGVHRLAHTVAEWAQAIADEGGREATDE